MSADKYSLYYDYTYIYDLKVFEKYMFKYSVQTVLHRLYHVHLH
jgi:hypothetical protein